MGKTHSAKNLMPTAFVSRLGHILRTVSQYIHRVQRHLTRRNILWGGSTAVALLIGAYTVVFFWPRAVTFSYAGNSCITSPVLLPNLISKKQSTTYSAKPTASLSVAGYPVYSHTTCISPVQAPAEQSSEVIGFGSAWLQKRIRVSAGAYPSLTDIDRLKNPVPTQKSLSLELDTPDHTFDYRLQANGKNTACTTQEHSLVCDIAELSLEQSATYDFTLQRLFNEEPVQTVFEHPVTTVESVHINDTNIAADQTIYDAPAALTLTLNRAVVSVDGARLQLVKDDNRQEVPITTSVAEDTVTIQFEQLLERQASFVLTVDRVTAADGGFLASPFSLPFSTSGGPQVRGVNIGNYRVSRNSTIVITFDSAVSREQNIGEFVRLEAGGNTVAANVSANGHTVTIAPHHTLPRCAPLTVRVLDGLQNEHGISGGSVWHHSSRTLCQLVAGVGTSVHGRGITAYHFGDGPSTVVYVGGIHGNEKSSVHTLHSWIDQLEANPGRIPAHRRIVVIPNANPDGYAANTRNNANNVDLNRNFPTHDWKPDVTFGNGTHNPTGGGTAPLSEPESSALASYTLGLSPRLVLTYHSIAGYVIPNDAGDSDALARTYAEHSNLRYASHHQTSQLFPYDTTGAYEDWLHDRYGIPALLLELWTRAGNEYRGNQAAMWHMAGL